MNKKLHKSFSKIKTKNNHLVKTYEPYGLPSDKKCWYRIGEPIIGYYPITLTISFFCKDKLFPCLLPKTKTDLIVFDIVRSALAY